MKIKNYFMLQAFGFQEKKDKNRGPNHKHEKLIFTGDKMFALLSNNVDLNRNIFLETFKIKRFLFYMNILPCSR